MTRSDGPRPGGLRILTVAPLPASVTGGVEEYAFGVVSGLRDLGHEVRVMTSRVDNEPSPPLAAGDIPIRTLMLLGRPIPWSPSVVTRLLREIRRSDLVHLHMPYPVVESLVGFLCRLTRTPLVVTYQMDALILPSGTESAPEEKFRTVERAYRFLSARWPLNVAGSVVTSTRAYVNESVMLPGYRDKVQIIYQGISKSRFGLASQPRQIELRRSLLGDRYRKLVSFVGRLVPYKGVEYLLQAIPEVGVPDVLYYIGGRGPEDEALRAIASRLGLSNVRFAGFVPDSELFDLFRVSDVIVSPSVSSLENTPIGLLGAMAVGTPVVGTTVGGTGETVPNDHRRGIIVPPRDSHAVAGAIRELLSAPARPSDPPTVRFWEDVARDYEGLFVSTLNKNPG